MKGRGTALIEITDIIAGSPADRAGIRAGAGTGSHTRAGIRTEAGT